MGIHALIAYFLRRDFAGYERHRRFPGVGEPNTTVPMGRTSSSDNGAELVAPVRSITTSANGAASEFAALVARDPQPAN